MMEKIKSVYRFLSPKFQSVHLEYKVKLLNIWSWQSFLNGCCTSFLIIKPMVM